MFYLNEYNREKDDLTVADIKYSLYARGAGGVMVIVAGNGHGDTSSNPGRDWLHFI